MGELENIRDRMIKRAGEDMQTPTRELMTTLDLDGADAADALAVALTRAWLDGCEVGMVEAAAQAMEQPATCPDCKKSFPIVVDVTQFGDPDSSDADA
jgi:hypothetical protein